jgi:hypothetical protein
MNMKRMYALLSCFAAAGLSLLCMSCLFQNPADLYADIPGKATIVEVAPSGYNPTPATMTYLDVFFDFTPDDPAARNSYVRKSWSDRRVRLFVDHRGNLPSTWVQQKGISVGKTYRAVRSEYRGGGTLPPVRFAIPEFESQR